MVKRCSWANHSDLMKRYHDFEWGVPVYDDKLFFEQLILQGAQAGLSWFTILKKRNNYHNAFDGFDFEKIALYDEEKVNNLLNNKGIIRNQLKIRSAIKNAKTFIELRKKEGSFSEYIWRFVNSKPTHNDWESLNQIPGNTELSAKISIDMKKRGFSFIGPTIIYAFMQATGLVNDHLVSCFRHNEIKKLSIET
ncbi:MAG: DNA-3-methyladenine glycosylase I [Candidatus Lokiarchaeota archaeon]|nr:DNA-3-methyladenine glycosylase I [Candidatus Lokiarchaeota archaeon]MBD3200704.1 DNA-3-methyladenine glycosylase I [Candidatus Lokiarchaeota archaeon]